MWVDRQGSEYPLAAPPRGSTRPRLSPDGQRIAVSFFQEGSGGSQVWIYHLRNDRMSLLIFEGINQFPVWTPDGTRSVLPVIPRCHAVAARIPEASRSTKPIVRSKATPSCRVQ